MANIEKKKQKIRDEIARVETQIKESLTKKKNGATEINLVDVQTKIARLNEELRNLK